MKRQRKRFDWEDIKQRLRLSQHDFSADSAPDQAALEAVFRRRATQLAVRGRHVADAAGTFELLTVAVGAERYGIELAALAEIVPLANWAAVPGGPPELLGVMNLRGDLYSVIDLSPVLSTGAAVDEPLGYVVMVRRGTGLVGLRVDRIESVERPSRAGLTPLDDSEIGSAAPWLSGIVLGNVIVLNIDKLFTRAGCTV